jgi:Uncharacterized conserved protein
METMTRVVLLTHPKEYKRQRTGTGRLASINLANCEIVPGLAFDGDPRVGKILDDGRNSCFLLYPSPDALDLSEFTERRFAEGEGEEARLELEELIGRGEKRLVVFLIDSTWACANAVLRESPRIAGLPRLRFQPRNLSRWVIKKQPRDYCLSTIEAIHELLLALEAAGLDSYPDKRRLLGAFAAMQDYQIERSQKARRPRHIEH